MCIEYCFTFPNLDFNFDSMDSWVSEALQRLMKSLKAFIIEVSTFKMY